MKTRGIHLVELSRREARTTGLGELLELPQHGLLRPRQTVYDDLHRRRDQVANDGAWASPFFIKTIFRLAKLDIEIRIYDEIHLQLGNCGIDSGLQIGDPDCRQPRQDVTDL